MCVHLPSGPTCVCKDGYTLSTDKKNCVDGTNKFYDCISIHYKDFNCFKLFDGIYLIFSWDSDFHHICWEKEIFF